MPDPTADFLFGDRTGYCVHFAHAAVLLWRALGIPARVGTGYRTEEDDRHGSSTILIRASDAHAWPELYLDGIGLGRPRHRRQEDPRRAAAPGRLRISSASSARWPGRCRRIPAAPR